MHSAGIQDRDGAKQVLNACRGRYGRYPRWERIWADSGYRGQPIPWVKQEHDWALEIVSKSPDQRGFRVSPRRWVVERTFAWLGRYRRLAKDYDLLPETSEAWIYIAMTHLMLRRIAT